MDIMKLLEKINVRGTTVLMVTHAKDIVDKMNKRVVAIDHGRIVRDEEGSYGFVQQTEPEEDLYVPGFTTFLDPNELRAAQAQINRKNERARGRTSAVNDPVGYDDSLVNTYLDGGEDVYE
jgi:ABC-type methionine transport system ATPase subunit